MIRGLSGFNNAGLFRGAGPPAASGPVSPAPPPSREVRTARRETLYRGGKTGKRREEGGEEEEEDERKVLHAGSTKEHIKH